MGNKVIKDNLVKKLKQKESKIGVIGLGYVGLPLSLSYAEASYEVIGFDINTDLVEKIKRGSSYINHISSKRVSEAVLNHKLKASTNINLISEVDAIIICVPTPLTINRDPDLSFIINTMNSIKPFLRDGQVISLESTTYPGTTEEILRPIIESTGKKIGQEIFLIYSPEREDPGNKKFNTVNIPKVLGGSTSECKEVGNALYENIISKIITVSSTKAAEMTKLLENIHRSVNIGLMNELKQLTEKMGMDLYEIINAASTKPFGFVPYYPGPGLGGHCIPIDPFYLTWKAREFGVNTRFIELAGEINTFMPTYVVQRTASALNISGKALNGSKVLILGLSYKKNIDDVRESPSVLIMKLLIEQGVNVEYSDPFFPEFPRLKKYSFDLKSIDITPTNLCKFDAVILTTDHDDFDYECVLESSNLIIDTRGKYEKSEKVFRA